MTSIEEKLARFVTLFSSEINKALSAAEKPLDSLVCRLVTDVDKQEQLGISSSSTPRFVSEASDSPSGGSMTEIGKQVKDLVGRIRRFESALRAVDETSLTTSEELSIQLQDKIQRISQLEQEAQQHKELFEVEHERLVALEKEKEQRKLQEKRDLFKLLDPSAHHSPPITSSEGNTTAASNLSPTSPRRNVTSHHQRFASVGGSGSEMFDSSSTSSSTATTHSNQEGRGASPLAQEAESVDARQSVDFGVLSIPNPPTPRTTAELITAAELLLAQVEQAVRSKSPPPQSTTTTTANLNQSNNQTNTNNQAPTPGSPTPTTRNRASSTLETLFLNPQSPQQSTLSTSNSLQPPSSPNFTDGVSPKTPSRKHHHHHHHESGSGSSGSAGSNLKEST